VANFTYQLTQLPFVGPASVRLTAGLALTNTSPCWTPPLMSVARALEPPAKPFTVIPVDVVKPGPMTLVMTSVSEPA